MTMDRQLLLLGLLRAQEMHGYQLNEFIDEQMNFCVDLKRSTAYYLLDKLCREGHVAEEIEREGNRPERKVYRITPTGEARFQELLRQNLAAYDPPVYAEDIGVIFEHQLAADESLRLLSARRDAILAHRAQMEALHVSLPPSHTAVIEHHLLHLDAEITWVDRLIAARSANSSHSTADPTPS
ncbi:PadR family transcriptional regulator [Oscillochloris sp. ZM17-4]|uniref:PadR family transcriptional regulator n=1 Tax=Oscillochloris sp. ZM17-4 TaxID=2866714 RepID=UPI001C736215|nr:PadR family transcriptional regulator [Oscillochloris sp. ZM17-4]MBX0330778.1 PadR family transcriptional regulator [Oscillochloris sp. ZM17-4]